MFSRFVIHQHKAGRPHYDLRLIQEGVLRSWSLLKEPPRRVGERRLAIERESYPAGAIDSGTFEEEAFGRGRVFIWDQGDVEARILTPRNLALNFRGGKITGYYEMRRMLWYPGNRWLLAKKRAAGPQANPPTPSGGRSGG